MHPRWDLPHGFPHGHIWPPNGDPGIRDQIASGYLQGTWHARRSLIWLQPSTMASSKPAMTMRPSRAPWCPPWPCRWGRTSVWSIAGWNVGYVWICWMKCLGFPWLKNWDLHNFGFCDLFGKPKSIFYPVTPTSDIHPSRWTLGSLTSTPSRWSLQTDRLVSRSVIERRSSGEIQLGPFWSEDGGSRVLKWLWVKTLAPGWYLK